MKYLTANDYPTYQDALKVARKLGVTDIAGSGDRFFAYVPQFPIGPDGKGYTQYDLFKKHNNWHLGAATRFTKTLPDDAESIQKAYYNQVTENPRRNRYPREYTQKQYFRDITSFLLQFGFTTSRAERALQMYKSDLVKYYDNKIPAAQAAIVIKEYFPGQ